MVKKYAYFGGFTLAEVMIVLTVIGVLTAILLPVARQSMPDEDLMKFKKYHNMLGTVVRELVTSDKYYLDGDLSVQIDGNCTTGEYFLNSFADIINYQKILRSSATPTIKPCTPNSSFQIISDEEYNEYKNKLDDYEDVDSEISMPKILMKAITSGSGVLQLSDDVWLIVVPSMKGTNHDFSFASIVFNYDFSSNDKFNSNDGTQILRRLNGLEEGEPVYTFSYAIRNDGKIITSKVVDEWLERDVNEE